MRKMLALVALMLLTACDYAARRDLKRERESRLYQSAMTDYRAGRIDAALKGFERVTAEEPDNAAARFQLGCLLQDHRKDWLGALCAYREYLSQRPDSDKSQLARDRMSDCERALAEALAEKYKLFDQDASQVTSLQQSLKTAETEKKTLETELETVRRRVQALVAEREHLVKAVKGLGDDGESVAPPRSVAKEAKDLLEEADETSDREKIAAEVAELKKESDADEVPTGSSLLPARKPEDLAQRQAQEEVEERERQRRAEEEKTAVRRPPTYVVQSGDTLYRIAVRFYGHISAWKRIRDANKATISTDGRVRSGQVIKLP